jgi:hypothetical protein
VRRRRGWRRGTGSSRLPTASGIVGIFGRLSNSGWRPDDRSGALRGDDASALHGRSPTRLGSTDLDAGGTPALPGLSPAALCPGRSTLYRRARPDLRSPRSRRCRGNRKARLSADAADRGPAHQRSARTRRERRPMPGISTSTTSPSRSCGIAWRAPEKITSPGSSVTVRESSLTMRAGSHWKSFV